jgi:hypothetical protein
LGQVLGLIFDVRVITRINAHQLGKNLSQYETGFLVNTTLRGTGFIFNQLQYENLSHYSTRVFVKKEQEIK